MYVIYKFIFKHVSWVQLKKSILTYSYPTNETFEPYILNWIAFLRSFFPAINISMDASLLVNVFLEQNKEAFATCTLSIWVFWSSILLKMDCKGRVLIESKIIGVSRCECLDYLCDIAARMKLHGLDPTAKPKETSDSAAVWWECAIIQHIDTLTGNV